MTPSKMSRPSTVVCRVSSAECETIGLGINYQRCGHRVGGAYSSLAVRPRMASDRRRVRQSMKCMSTYRCTFTRCSSSWHEHEHDENALLSSPSLILHTLGEYQRGAIASAHLHGGHQRHGWRLRTTFTATIHARAFAYTKETEDTGQSILYDGTLSDNSRRVECRVIVLSTPPYAVLRSRSLSTSHWIFSAVYVLLLHP